MVVGLTVAIYDPFVGEAAIVCVVLGLQAEPQTCGAERSSNFKIAQGNWTLFN